MATTNNRRAVKKETALSEDSSLVIQDPIAPAKEPETLDELKAMAMNTNLPVGPDARPGRFNNRAEGTIHAATSMGIVEDTKAEKGDETVNKKEIAEIKRRTTAAKTTASAIFGCFVSASREQISSFSVPTLDMDEQEGNQYFGIFKKILAPQLGAKSFNLEMDVNFVANSEEHKLLMALRKSRMKDGGLRAALYDKIIENVTMEQNYLILVDFETYDVPNKQDAEQSDEVFSYFLVAICPVKQSKAELSYITSSKDFHNKSNGQVSGSPLYGFMFPAFNERVTDINSALFFANKTENGSADRLAKALFGCELPAGEETTREKFTGVMRTALGDECGMEVVRQLQSELALMTEASEADAERGQEPLKLDKQDLTRILEQKCGMEQHQSELFATAFDEAFGKDAEMEPKNMMELVKYKVSTPNVSISLKREAAHDVQMRTIDGIPYILVRADDGVELNGIPLDRVPGGTELQ